jgi:1-acyl-sn-glycerol-3-phosphate acyltransferase
MSESSSSQKLNKVEDAPRLPNYSKFGIIKVKGLDFSIPIGTLFIASVFGWVLMLYPPLIVAFAYSKLFDPKRRRLVDWVIHVWAKMAMLSMTYKPTLRGVENLPPASEAVMYIPNHCSYLDIFTLSGFLPRPFKYVSKIEVLRIPLIGWAMRLAGHIAIERNDKRSQLQTFKDTVVALQQGNSVVTFAEGTRSKDGRIAAFKKGPIKMAIKAGVRIVPVSIADLHRWMPDSALVPLAVPRGVTVTVHPAIDPAAAAGEDAVLAAVLAAVNSALPPHQRADPALLGPAPGPE